MHYYCNYCFVLFDIFELIIKLINHFQFYPPNITVWVDSGSTENAGPENDGPENDGPKYDTLE
jgi:hypothetical protein